MSRTRWAAALGAAAAVGRLPGSLTLYSKTEVVRGDERRQPVAFENPKAAETFHAIVKKQSGQLDGTHVGVPFVTLVSKDRKLSENARWNDAVIRCDTDQNGTITADEAAIFAQIAE